MKTKNNKKTLTAGVIMMLLSFFFTQGVISAQNYSFNADEVYEEDIQVEPWMSSVEAFRGRMSELISEKINYTLVYEEDEPELTIEPWMYDLSYFKRNNKMQTLKTVSLITCIHGDIDKRLL